MAHFPSRLQYVYKKILFGIVALLVVVAGAHFFVEYTQQRLVHILETQINEQQNLLIELATATNNAHDTIIKDCSVSERTRFDTLLAELDNTLSRDELTELDRLFGRCGAFYAERKVIAVHRLKREVEIYETYVEQLQALELLPISKEYQIETWRTLVEVEQLHAESFLTLVSLQDKIIKTLLEGKTADSDEIKTILTEVSATQNQLSLTNRQAADIRETVRMK